MKGRLKDAVKLRVVGNEKGKSWYVRIPPEIRNAMNLNEGDLIIIEAHPANGTIVLRVGKW
ncbi:MAG: AbrB/MazE/SpoVT family DNA-binding domain-containing protein [Bacillaceae bacterium]|nr:AbrB/MazE/SpoVT family DNA-binding domain-containing protein [Bacillaceae bacterium]